VKPEFHAENQTEGWVTSALTTVVALFAVVGIGTGDVPRVLRNHPLPASFTIGFVVLAGFCVVAAGWFVSNQGWEKIVIRAGTLAVAIAVGGAVWTGIESSKERPEPAVTAQIVTNMQGVSTLHFEVKDTGLRSRDRMAVLIRAIPEGTDASVRSTTLYGATLGPDSSGSVDHAGEVAVPPAPDNDVEVQAWVGKRHGCKDEEIPTTGCVALHITRLFEKPQLSIAWREPAHSDAGAAITLSAHDISNHRVVLRVMNAENGRLLLDASWPSNATGSVEETITAIIPRSTARLCVAASTTESSPSCSTPEGSGDATILTAVPPD
jgi:hypothetical protein